VEPSSKAALTNGAVDDGEDRLFDTLDTVLRRLWLPSGRQVVMSDTVGFISDLPTQLFDAFKVTHVCTP
jgi:GTP-binding protein HflX